MHVCGGSAQVIARLEESGEGRPVGCNDCVRAGKTTEKVRAKLASVRPRSDARKRIFAIEAEHRYGRACRYGPMPRGTWRSATGGFCVRMRSTDMTQEGLLQGRDASAVIGFNLWSFDVPDGGAELPMVGYQFDLI